MVSWFVAFAALLNAGVFVWYYMNGTRGTPLLAAGISCITCAGILATRLIPN